MRVFLPHGFAFEVSTYCGHCGLIRRIEHIGQRAMPGAVAFMHHLQYLDRGDQGGSSEVLERPTFLYARGFDVEALRFHDAEQLLDGPTLPIEADDPPGCRKVRRGVRCQQTPMWRLEPPSADRSRVPPRATARPQPAAAPSQPADRSW